MDLSIIIVNFNTCNDTLKCIESIKAGTLGINYEIIVVDNDSSDGSLPQISAKFPDVICLQSGYNAGFARANNLGIRQSAGDYILLLNSDTELNEGVLSKTVERMKSNPKIAAAGVQLLNSDFSLQFSGGPKEKGTKWIYNIPYFGFLYQKFDRLFHDEKYMVQNHDSGYVDWIIGAFICVSRKVLEKAGLLDEDFFLYAEEIEWCDRIKKCGDLIIFRDLKVLHHMGVSSSSAFLEERTEKILIGSKKERQRVLSLMLYLRKSQGWWRAYWFHLMFTIGFPFFFFGRIIVNILKLKWPWSKLSECFQFLINLWIWRYNLILMITKKPHFYKTL